MQQNENGYKFFKTMMFVLWFKTIAKMHIDRSIDLFPYTKFSHKTSFKYFLIMILEIKPEVSASISFDIATT